MNAKLAHYWNCIQPCLYADFEKNEGPVLSDHQRIMVVLDMLELERHIYETALPQGRGRPAISRVALAKAFVAKAMLNLHSNVDLVERLKLDRVLFRICGFDPRRKLPCEATFSNSFSEFAKQDILNRIHAAIVSETLKNQLVFHVSRDSTDVPAREKFAKVKKEEKGKRKTKKLKGKHRRLARQASMSIEEMIEDLPKELGASTKRGHSWKGYKLHLDVADGGIPISVLITSAQVHDSQAAIPLEEITSKRIRSLYSLMDSAYDAKEIRDFTESKGKVALIEPHRRLNNKAELDPVSRKRFSNRTSVERVFGWLKDNFGMRRIQVRGPSKVMAHIMFGILSLTALRLISTA